MKNLFLILLSITLSGCASFNLSTLNHDPIYDTVLVVSSDTQVDTLNEFQFRNKLRTDFNFRYDFAQYALSQPRSFDWNNRILGNRYNVYNPYYGFGYSNYWNRDQMWNDWVWGYPFFQSHNMWSAWGYDRWGFNNYGYNNYGWNGYNNWYNGPWHNQGYNAIWNRSRENVSYNVGRRGSNNVISRNIQNNKVITNSKPRINIEETNLEQIVTNIRKRINKPNLNNINTVPIRNNYNKPRVNVKPNINNINNNSVRIYNRPSVNNTRPSNNVVRGNTNSRGGNSIRKN
jgi:hypothetical protein